MPGTIPRRCPNLAGWRRAQQRWQRHQQCSAAGATVKQPPAHLGQPRHIVDVVGEERDLDHGRARAGARRGRRRVALPVLATRSRSARLAVRAREPRLRARLRPSRGWHRTEVREHPVDDQGLDPTGRLPEPVGEEEGLVDRVPPGRRPPPRTPSSRRPAAPPPGRPGRGSPAPCPRRRRRRPWRPPRSHRRPPWRRSAGTVWVATPRARRPARVGIMSSRKTRLSRKRVSRPGRVEEVQGVAGRWRVDDDQVEATAHGAARTASPSPCTPGCRRGRPRCCGRAGCRGWPPPVAAIRRYGRRRRRRWSWCRA